jgi:glycosidase
MKPYAIILFLATLFFFSCSPKEEPVDTLTRGGGIIGLASPVKMSPDTTRVFLLDYFEFADKIDSVWFHSDAEFTLDTESAIVTVTAYDGSPVSNLSVKYDGGFYDIPVFRSKKEKYTFSYQSQTDEVAQVGLKANFNGWNASANPLEKQGDEWTTTLFLEPGLYEYLIVEDGEEMLDPNNPDKKDNGMGGFNSVLSIGSVSKPEHIAANRFTEDSIFLYYPASLEEPLIYWENKLLDTDYYNRSGNVVSVSLAHFSNDLTRAHVRVYGQSETNYTNDLLIPLSGKNPVTETGQLSRNDKQTWTMYFMMVDRFFNANSENDQPVDDPAILPPANYYGGDIEGVNQKVQEGYFEELGVNTVWLSPIGANPLGAYGLWDKGGVVSKFSGYHGYWPTSSTEIDFRMGSEKALNTLIDNAHQNYMNVILDYVANHVHEEHPVYQEHPEWATDLYLPDGSLNTEKWDEHRLTTWFDTFMPTLDLRKDEVVEAMTDSALYWFENYQIDGFRHDATKHIPLKFWRSLTRKLKYQVVLPQERTIYQIGETYGSPELIDSYIGSGLLDAQFDFNLYDAAVSAFAKDDGSCKELRRVLEQSISTYGSHHLMGNISGNQDRTRFISFADGSVEFGEDYKLAGWTRKIEIQDTIGYNRLGLLHAFNFAVPGIPVIYYGDEIGMPGANDPDNRRMMRFGDELSDNESRMLQTVSMLCKIREGSMALNYGDTEILLADEESLIIARKYFGETAILIINTTGAERTVSIEMPEYYDLEQLESNFNHSFKLNGRELELTMQPVSFELLTN